MSKPNQTALLAFRTAATINKGALAKLRAFNRERRFVTRERATQAAINKVLSLCRNEPSD